VAVKARARTEEFKARFLREILMTGILSGAEDTEAGSGRESPERSALQAAG
jgi:hypothetical protein